MRTEAGSITDENSMFRELFEVLLVLSLVANQKDWISEIFFSKDAFFILFINFPIVLRFIFILQGRAKSLANKISGDEDEC